jgi:hypothetical protein
MVEVDTSCFGLTLAEKLPLAKKRALSRPLEQRGAERQIRTKRSALRAQKTRVFSVPKISYGLILTKGQY